MTTAQFNVTPSRLAASIMRLWLRDNWWTLAIAPAISLMLAAMGDVRFLFVALILIFVVIPPVMFIIYFYYGMTPEARFSILPHRVTADNAGLHIIYAPCDDETAPRSPDTIDRRDLYGATLDDKYLYVRLRAPRYALVMIPVDSLHADAGPYNGPAASPTAVAHQWLNFLQNRIKSGMPE